MRQVVLRLGPRVGVHRFTVSVFDALIRNVEIMPTLKIRAALHALAGLYTQQMRTIHSKMMICTTVVYSV